MAYQIKKKKHVVKDLDLMDGAKIAQKLHVDIIVDDFRNRYPQVMKDVKEAQELLDKNGDDDIEAITACQIAVKAVFVLVFGEMQTRKFLEYYENRYYEAFLDVIPFITEEILPEVKKAVKEENNRIESIMK